MAQPPAVIVQAYEPVGHLRLYRLDEHAQFYCVHCCKDKTDSIVATTHDNWAKTICKACYDSLARRQEPSLAKIARANRQPGQAKQKVKATEPGVTPLQLSAMNKTLTKAAGAKRQPGQAKQQPSRKAEAQQERETLLQLAARREQQLQRHLPGVDQLLAFFRAADVRVEVGRRGCLLINGIQTRPLAWILPSPDRIDWDDVIDDMALKYTGGKFLKAVADNARFGEGLRAFLRPHLEGFAIMRGDVRLAVIRATRAEIPHREIIHGNFLRPGPQWQQVADVVHGAEAELVAQWKRQQEARAATEVAAAKVAAEQRRTAGRRRIDHFSNDLPQELIDACLDASRRIRLERQVAYERPVVLQCDFGELTLLPIAGTETRLLMPFRLSKGVETLTGELILSHDDPLPLLIGEDVSDDDAIAAWAYALLGTADATCVELEPVEPTVRREPARARWRPPSSPFQQHSSARTLPRKRWPKHLEPVGQWVQYSGAFVAGHRRRLNDDQTASAEARDRARQVGITLNTHETWVRPHTRGLPDGIEMRFRWHAPSELKLSP